MQNKSIYVISRIRPINQTENNRRLKKAVFGTEGKITVNNSKKTITGEDMIVPESFNFDKVFEDHIHTKDIFVEQCKPIIENSIQGGVGSILAFGQTGSGKTYTITNLIEHISTYIFQFQKKISQQMYNGTDVFITKLRAIQILGNDITDLNKKNKVQIMENKQGKIEILQAVEHQCAESGQMAATIQTSFQCRKTEATQKNHVSSRSHAVIEIVFKNTAISNSEEGKLQIIDLAGSERNKDSLFHDKERIKESQAIMSSLMNLKDCIRNRTLQLEDQSSNKHYHIPFRHNKLTLLLKESLETENSRTTLSLFICNVSPNNEDCAHSINSLKQAEGLQTHNSIEVKEVIFNKKDPSTWSNAECLEILQKREKKITAEWLDGMDGKRLLDIPQNLFMQKLIDIGIPEMKADSFYKWIWGMFIDSRAKKKKRLMKPTHHDKFKEMDELEEAKLLKEQNKNNVNEPVVQLNHDSITKPNLTQCNICGKKVNENLFEKHKRLCNYSGNNLRMKKLEKCEEIQNKIDSGEKVGFNNDITKIERLHSKQDKENIRDIKVNMQERIKTDPDFNQEFSWDFKF